MTAPDTSAAEFLDAKLAEFAADAARWLTEVQDQDDNLRTPSRTGWGIPSAPKDRSRRDQRYIREAKHAGIEQHCEQCLAHVTATREAVNVGNAILAAAHALLAGHSHGAAYIDLASQREESERKRANRYDKSVVPVELLAERFAALVRQGETPAKALQQLEPVIGLSAKDMKKRLQDAGHWPKRATPTKRLK